MLAVGALPADPRLLHHVIRFTCTSKHPIGDAEQPRTHGLERRDVGLGHLAATIDRHSGRRLARLGVHAGLICAVMFMPRACSGAGALASGEVPRRVPSRRRRVPSRCRVPAARSCHDSRACPVFASAHPIDAQRARLGSPTERALLMPSTIVLVHGAFAESASWDRVIARLEGAGSRRDRRRQPAARPRLRRRGCQRPRPHDRRPGRARRPLLRGRRDLERRRRRRRDRRARLRQRIRPGARRELLRARGHVPGQHARRGDVAAGPAQRRNDRPLHRCGTASTTSSARTSPRRRPR